MGSRGKKKQSAAITDRNQTENAGLYKIRVYNEQSKLDGNREANRLC